MGTLIAEVGLTTHPAFRTSLADHIRNIGIQKKRTVPEKPTAVTRLKKMFSRTWRAAGEGGENDGSRVAR